MTDYIDNNIFRQYLTQDEYVVWSGKPERIRLFTLSDIFLVPFSIMWCGFAVFWEYQVIHSNAPRFLTLWGIPFIIVGIYIVFGRFVTRYITLKNTVYAVTNRRILFLRGNRLTTLSAQNLPPMNVSMNSDGTGTITFDAPYHYSRVAIRGFGGGFDNVYALENIRDVNRAQSAILSMNRD